MPGQLRHSSAWRKSLNLWRTLIRERDPLAVFFQAIRLELHTRVFPGFAPPLDSPDARRP
jgi:hypothetical protein